VKKYLWMFLVFLGWNYQADEAEAISYVQPSYAGFGEDEEPARPE